MQKGLMEWLMSRKQRWLILLAISVILVNIILMIDMLRVGYVFTIDRMSNFDLVLIALMGVTSIFMFVYLLRLQTLTYRLKTFLDTREEQTTTGLVLSKVLKSDYKEYLNDCFADHKNYKQKAKYEFLKQQAQFDAMQSQINPHFLYNALDSIRGLAMEQEAEETANMAEALSSMFRYSISQSDDLQTLEEEIDNVRNYMKIQQYRFQNRFKLIIDVQIKHVCEYLLPKLTLQPIIENSIYHGFDEIPENNVISITAMTTQSRLLISVSDNGSGMDDDTLLALNKRLLAGDYAPRGESSDNRSKGIALVNVNSRIKLIFGNHYGLTAYSTKGVGTEIRISLPLINKKRDE